jgi:beta-galactosidase
VTRQRWNDGWAYRPKVNSLWDLAGAGATTWQEVMLPHDAMIHGTRTPQAGSATGYHEGGVWEYRKTLSVPLDWRDGRVYLQFEGVYRGAMVYVNGDLAATRPYGYSEFTVPLDRFLRFGAENTIKVEARAHKDSRWYPGGGIYRNVWLSVLDPVHVAIDGVTITTPSVDDEGAIVAVATEVQNETVHTRTVRVAHEITDVSGGVVASGVAPLTLVAGETGVVRQSLLVADPQRWGTEHPHLYSCRTTVLDPADDGRTLDEVSNTFGIRSLSVDAKRGLRINGETVKLRGACVHHDNGPIGAATIDRAEDRRVELLKAAGFNAIRSAHNPISRAMLAACDRLGMLVMDESFDMWTEPKTDDDYANQFSEWWRADIESMVRKDRNHPSVIMYSIGNEIPDIGRPLGSRIGRELADAVRALDPTRLVTNCVQPILAIRGFLAEMREKASAQTEEAQTEPGVNTMLSSWQEMIGPLLRAPFVGDAIEEACAHTDVAGYNYVDARYVIDGELHPNRVIVGSETHSTNLHVNWPLVEQYDHVIGDFTWVGWDYLGEAGIGRTEYVDDAAEPGGPPTLVGEYPWIVASSGDFDILGHRRPASYYREIVFGLRTDPYIAVQRPARHGQTVAYSGPWSWSDTVGSWSWPGFEGKPVLVEVYSADDEVDLVLNGTSLGRQPAGVANKFTAKFETTYAPGELVAVGYRDGGETGRSALVSAGSDVVLRAEVDRAAIRADDTDLAYVGIALVDANGVVHNGADRAVTVAVDGPGVVQGFGSADPAPLESFDDATRTTYDGRALAVIRPTGPGRITVTLTANGCAPVAATIEVAS